MYYVSVYDGIADPYAVIYFIFYAPEKKLHVNIEGINKIGAQA